MGRVWRAWDPRMEREVAVKEVVFPPQITQEEHDKLVTRAIQEAKAAGQVNHPSVITIYDEIEHEGSPWIVMEYIDGRSLGAEIRASGPLPWERAAEIGEQIAGGLAAAHKKRIVHRDLKPDNVLLHEDRVIVTDFGIARVMDSSAQLTTQGVIIGTPSYMAPEQLRDSSSASAASDLWALGCTLYCAVEGTPPYKGPSYVALMESIMAGRRPPADHAGPLGEVLDALLVTDPGRRPDAKTAAGLLAGLRPRVASTGSSTLPGPPPEEERQPTVKLKHVQPAPVPTQAEPTHSMERPPVSFPAPDFAPPGPSRPVTPPPDEKPKRRGPLIGAAAVVAAALIGLGVYLGDSPGHKPAPGPTGHPVVTSSPEAPKPPVCAPGSLQLFGSTAFQGIAQQAANQYMATCGHQATIQVKGGGSAFGVGRVTSGSTVAMYDGTTQTGLTPHPVGVLIYSVIAHHGLFPGMNVTTSQLARIFVRHDYPGVIAVGRTNGSGSRKNFNAKAIPGTSPGPASKTGCLTPAAAALRSCTEGSTPAVISFVNSSPKAVGYAEILGFPQTDPQLDQLSLNGVPAETSTVENGQYRFWAAENLYTSAQPSPLATDFINYLPSYIKENTTKGLISCLDVARLCARS